MLVCGRYAVAACRAKGDSIAPWAILLPYKDKYSGTRRPRSAQPIGLLRHALVAAFCFFLGGEQARDFRGALEQAELTGRPVRFVRWGHELPHLSLEELSRRNVYRFASTGRSDPISLSYEISQSPLRVSFYARGRPRSRGPLA